MFKYFAFLILMLPSFAQKQITNLNVILGGSFLERNEEFESSPKPDIGLTYSAGIEAEMHMGEGYLNWSPSIGLRYSKLGDGQEVFSVPTTSLFEVWEADFGIHYLPSFYEHQLGFGVSWALPVAGTKKVLIGEEQELLEEYDIEFAGNVEKGIGMQSSLFIHFRYLYAFNSKYSLGIAFEQSATNALVNNGNALNNSRRSQLLFRFSYKI